MLRASEVELSVDPANRARLLAGNFVRAFREFWQGYFKSPHGC
jgi:hypothetical protein